MHIESICFGLFFLSVIVSGALSFHIFEILKNIYPEKYEALGKPSLWGTSLGNQFKFLLMIYKREWNDLNDENLNIKGNVLVFSLTIGYLSWLVLFVFLIFK